MGSASEAEYLEIGLAARVDPQQLRADVNAAMPSGLDLLDAVEAGPGDLAARLEVSRWQIELRQLDAAQVAPAIDAFLAETTVEVDRMTKNGVRRFDARGAVRQISVRSAPEGAPVCAILTVVVTHGTPSVRPDDVLAALRQVADLAPPVPPLVTRLAQGRLAADAWTVSDPLAPDRPDRLADTGAPRLGSDSNLSQDPEAVGA